ncbi:MAG: carbohydrate kinase family protein [Erysipelotrichaceae bacterium]|nr:carbohydrate kinase family protein [Erysipelotrichaceae bacterium]MBQ4254208.1 carbohydrate kinase family protein [Erysipelotrichaceae bacterium]
MGIVVFGATFVDVKGYPSDKYIPGGRNVGKVIQVHGGVSRNVTEDIANIGLKPVFVTVLDQSGISTDVIEKLEKHNVVTRYIRRIEGGLGTWLAIFDNNGDVVASISKRPDLSAIKDILNEDGDEIISECDSVVVEMDIEEDILNEIFDLAEKYNKEVYGVVSNMSIALERRNLIPKFDAVVCNQQEAGILFSEDYDEYEPQQLCDKIAEKCRQARIRKMVVTMGEKGAVYCDNYEEKGVVAPQKADVIDTTGAGDSFFAGVAIGLTYGKTLRDSCVIGTRLASAVISTSENVSPVFQPEEFGLAK